VGAETKMIGNIELAEETCKVSEPDTNYVSPYISRRRTRRRGHASRGRGGTQRGRGGRPVSTNPHPKPQDHNPVDSPPTLSDAEKEMRLKGDTVIHEVVLEDNANLL
jgi:hypothetical protein